MADDTTGVPEQRIELAAVLRHLAEQIRSVDLQVRREGTGTPVMQFKECELEFAVEVESEGGAGLNLYVLKLDAGMTSTNTNKIKIKYAALEGAVGLVAALEANPTSPGNVPARQAGGPAAGEGASGS